MIEKMPIEYRGLESKKSEYTKTAPREWTNKEIEWLQEKRNEGYSKEEIAYSMDRTIVSVSIKLKRLSKNNDSYNESHLLEKYDVNKTFMEKIKPNNILDLYCGRKSFYKTNYPNIKTTTNDIDTSIIADYHNDALKTICYLYSKDEKYDLIDLDPFGSAYDLFDLAIKMAKKGLCITFGELGHIRWKRLDYVSRCYDINKIEELTLDNLIEYVKKIGLRNKKELVVFDKKQWLNIGRVWFEIKPVKILKPQIKEERQLSLFDL